MQCGISRVKQWVRYHVVISRRKFPREAAPEIINSIRGRPKHRAQRSQQNAAGIRATNPAGDRPAQRRDILRLKTPTLPASKASLLRKPHTPVNRRIKILEKKKRSQTADGWSLGLRGGRERRGPRRNSGEKSTIHDAAAKFPRDNRGEIDCPAKREG
ncbi:hypothetical protein BP5796_08962 [Coleophoma crateriformis]|uniref:Uncharacterized protein n=1 Tax=Coleophoma crateriformis TaxID=565419 RepID=A0A3D8R2M4_9HELO|nr:hypothetical protein BP5796_08962 [Coleophoma crateriformis]